MKGKHTPTQTKQQSKKTPSGVKPKEANTTQPIPKDEITPNASMEKYSCTNKHEIIVKIPENNKGNDEEVTANSLFRKYLLINGFVLFFTFVLAVIAVTQFWITYQALKETQKQFEIDNKAYLQISRIDTVKPFYTKCQFSHTISNIGKQPAKILTTRGFFKFSNINKVDTGYMYKEISKLPWLPQEIYVNPGFPQPFFDPFPSQEKTKELSWFIDEKISVGILWQFIYINLATNKKYQFDCIAEITISNKTIGYRFLKNDNIEIK